MTKDKTSVVLFIDDDPQPIADLETPIVFDFDTTKLTDGEHTLKIVSKSPTGREGIRLIKFMVKNGPAISIEGLKAVSYTHLDVYKRQGGTVGNACFSMAF